MGRLTASCPATQAQRWVEQVALSVVRSGRQKLQETCDFIGLNAVGTLMERCRGQPRMRACLEEATLLLLEDVAAARGEEESSHVLAARLR